MAGKIGKRIYRAATSEEKADHLLVRKQIEAELPELRQRAQKKLTEIIRLGVELQQLVDLLKSERIKQGLTLAQITESTGIERATLARLENHEDVNLPIDTLTLYAGAIGKKVLVVLANAEE